MNMDITLHRRYTSIGYVYTIYFIRMEVDSKESVETLKKQQKCNSLRAFVFLGDEAARISMNLYDECQHFR